MIDIQGKKILLIGIGFYDYEKIIKQHLEEKGAQVWYFSSFYNSFLKKICYRLGMLNVAAKLTSQKILDNILQQPGDIDKIIVIKGEDFGEEHIIALDEKYPGVPRTLYLWDSLERLPNRNLLLKRFKTILTFDRQDAVKYGLQFRPLFYRDLPKTNAGDISYDICFVGYMHSMRYCVLRELKKRLSQEGLSYKFILTTGAFNKWYMLHVTHDVDKEDADIISTHQIPYTEYLDILMHSNVVLDIAHPKQSGLTMRTIETLALGKKLLTTNKDVDHYSFDRKQYGLLNLEQLDIAFIKEREHGITDMSEYSLDKFMEDIINA